MKHFIKHFKYFLGRWSNMLFKPKKFKFFVPPALAIALMIDIFLVQFK